MGRARVNVAPHESLLAAIGRTDIVLLDHILRGAFEAGSRLLDAGCGSGRNVHWFLGRGFDVCAIDTDPQALQHVREAAGHRAPDLPAENFRVEAAEATTFDDGSFDAVLAIALLHFARDDEHFDAMLERLLRLLRPGGLFFARLASDIGIESKVTPIGGRRFHLPDGSERFLVDEKMLIERTLRIGATLVDPIKTVNVQNARCMTTWAFRTARRDVS